MFARQRYVTAVLLSPYIGSLLLCVAGLAFGGLLLARTSRVRPGFNISKAEAAKAGLTGPLVLKSDVAPVKTDAVRPPVVRAAVRPQFTPISKDERQMLRETVGRRAYELMSDERVLRVVDEVVPYEPIHIGVDEPLTQALEGTLRRSTLPVTLRDGRYLMLSKVRETVPSSTPQSGRGRGFLWVDLETGMAIGGIYFYPTNGEPTPTLTLFSKQVGDRTAGMRALPAAFRQDLKAWGAIWNMPAMVTVTQYFIHREGRKTVLAHDEACDPSLAAAECTKQRAAAAEVDRRAMEYVSRTRYMPNATGRTLFAANE